MTEVEFLLADLITQARRAGADAADAVLFSGASLSVARRLGATEQVERSEGAISDCACSSAVTWQWCPRPRFDPAGFKALAERAVAMARVVPEDSEAGLAETMAPPEAVDLDLDDPTEPSTEQLIARAAAAGMRHVPWPASPIPRAATPAMVVRSATS